MRLPWPFGRAQRSPSSVGDSAGARPPSEGHSGPPHTLAPAASGAAWRSMPPLGETVGPPPLVAPNRPFAASLASREPRDPILAPLSHGRSLEAPRGIVSGIARATPSVAGAPLPTPVQRSPLGSASHSLMLEPDAEPDPEAAPGTGVAAAGTAPSTAPELETAPIRRLDPVVDTLPARKPLTSAPEPSRSAPLVGLVGPARAAGATTGLTPAPVPAIQRSPAAASGIDTVAASLEPSAGPAAAGPAEALDRKDTETAHVAGAPRLTIGQARRLGLGAPVAGGPVSAATPLFTGRPGLAGSTTAATAAAPPGTSVAPSRAGAGPLAPGAGVQRSPEPDAPEMPVTGRPARVPRDDAARSGAEPAMDGTTQSSPPAVTARPIEPAPRATASPRGPIVSSRPLRSSVQRAPLTLPQRAPEESASSAGSASAAVARPTSAGSPVKIHRDGQASQLSGALEARSFTHEGEIYLPASHGPLTSGTGRALLAHELTHVGQQRRLGSGIPGEDTAHGRRLEAEAVAAERSPEMTLAAAHAPDRPPATSAAAMSVDLGSDVAAGPAPGTQRAPAERSGAKGREDAPGGSGGSGGKQAHTHSEQELEVLAHQLYHRIGRHLRRELLVDRERVGFALDLP